jgi:hypothetical protein
VVNDEWRPVIDWEGIYEVSNLGQVRRVSPRRDWEGGTRIHAGTKKRVGQNPERILKPLLKSNYHQVCLSQGAGTEKWRTVHKLVAEAFLGPRPRGMSVNHKDGNKTNNCLDNLEYLSNRDQQLHAHANGFRGDYAFRSLTDEQAREVYLDDTRSGREWARILGVHEVTISAIRTGKSYRWATGAARAPETRTWRACTESCDCRCHYGFVAPPYTP